jgi:hypothetical protein
MINGWRYASTDHPDMDRPQGGIVPSFDPGGADLLASRAGGQGIDDLGELRRGPGQECAAPADR